MLRTGAYREGEHRVCCLRLLLYAVFILIFQQAMAGRLFSRMVHDTAASTRDFVGGNNTRRSGRCDISLRSTLLHPRTATGLTLDVISAAFASAAFVILTTAAIVALRGKHAVCDLFSIEEIRRSYLESSLGGAISSFALGTAANLSTIDACWQVELGVGVALFGLLLYGTFRSGIPACIESVKLDQISYRLDELSREITAIGRSSGHPGVADEAL